MQKISRIFLIAVLTAIFVVAPRAVAQDPAAPTPAPSIVESMTADSAVIIVQPAGLEDRVLFHLKEEVRKFHVDNRAGYRVQIFSDGNQATARNSARARIRQVSQRFPQYRTYLDYKSPYWRARVGDFKSREDANEAAAQLRGAFPAFSKEIRVVSDRISILDNN